MFYPLLQFSFFRSFFFREVRVNHDIAVKLIVFCSRKCLREEIDSRDSTFICWTRIEAKRNAFSIHPSFGILLAGWRFFIFIWEVRIRYWSRNLSQKFYRDVLMKRNPNWCIVAFWWSEIQIDRRIEIERNCRSSHCDEAKSKSMYRRILMKRNPNRCIVAFWWSEI